MGSIQSLTDEFYQKRAKLQMQLQQTQDSHRNKESLFQLQKANPDTAAYVSCVLRYDQIIGNELEKNLGHICK